MYLALIDIDLFVTRLSLIFPLWLPSGRDLPQPRLAILWPLSIDGSVRRNAVALLHGETARLKSPPSDNWGGPCAATAPRSGRSPRNWENEPWAAPLSRPPCVGAELPWCRRRRIILNCREPWWNFHVRNKRRFQNFVMSKKVDSKTRKRKHCNCNNNLLSVFCCKYLEKMYWEKLLSCDNW